MPVHDTREVRCSTCDYGCSWEYATQQNWPNITQGEPRYCCLYRKTVGSGLPNCPDWLSTDDGYYAYGTTQLP